MDLSVVVPAFNEARFVDGCVRSIFDSLSKASVSFEVIVVDNGSQDETGGVARKAGASVYAIDRSSVSTARNFGVSKSCGKFLAFIDADVLVDDAWAVAISRFISLKDADHFLTGCQYLVRSSPSWIEKYWFGNIKSSHINGGNLILSRAAFDVLGGFDDGLKTGEDVDLCVRAAASGMKCMPDPGFQAVHLGYPDTMRKFIRREFWHGEGDFKSFSAFWGSKVARISMVYLFLLSGVIVLMVAGLHGAALAVLLLLVLINLVITSLRFKQCGIKVVLINSVINGVYFVTRACSLARAIKNRRRSY